jgi:hypothetical protein
MGTAVNEYWTTMATSFLVAGACTVGAVGFYALGVRVQPHRGNVRVSEVSRHVRTAAALLCYACSAGIVLCGLVLFVSH